MTEKKRLYRDTENQKIFGVCAGLSDYFDMDVTLIRIVWVLLFLCAGTGFLAYIIMAILIDPKSVVMKKAEAEIRKAETIEPDDDPFAKYDKKK
jgi:phage shock protein C